MATGPTTSTFPESNPPFNQGLQGGDRKRTWQELHSNVKSMRRIHMFLANRVSLEFTFRVVETENGPRTRLYFLGVPPGNTSHCILQYPFKKTCTVYKIVYFIFSTCLFKRILLFVSAFD